MPEVSNANEDQLILWETKCQTYVNNENEKAFTGLGMRFGEKENDTMVLSVKQAIKLYSFLKEFLSDKYPIELISGFDKN